uniref:Uncharacterized protein LOC114336308 n=1 Tax=Diabrotica virgifera virgifera TaxID=50390 RepID=A0A6P7GC69_DIAVI
MRSKQTIVAPGVRGQCKGRHPMGEAQVEFDVSYTAPDDSIAVYEMLEDDQQMLMDIEQNIANIERNLASNASASANLPYKRTPEKTLQEKRKTTLKAVRSLIRFGKQRPPKDSDNEDETANLLDESGRNSRASDIDPTSLSRAPSQSSMSSIEGETSLKAPNEKQRRTSK